MANEITKNDRRFNAGVSNCHQKIKQTLVVKALSRDMLIGVEIVVCHIVRETSGLAMISSNKYLTDEEKSKAKILFQSLVATKEFIESSERNRKKINAFMHEYLRKLEILKIDYALAADAYNLSEPSEFEEGMDVVLLLGTILGKTRLIDNMVVKIPVSNYNEDERFQAGLK